MHCLLPGAKVCLSACFEEQVIREKSRREQVNRVHKRLSSVQWVAVFSSSGDPMCARINCVGGVKMNLKYRFQLDLYSPYSDRELEGNFSYTAWSYVEGKVCRHNQ